MNCDLHLCLTLRSGCHNLPALAHLFSVSDVVSDGFIDSRALGSQVTELSWGTSKALLGKSGLWNKASEREEG